jgi:hypothetical protein
MSHAVIIARVLDFDRLVDRLETDATSSAQLRPLLSLTIILIVIPEQMR